MKFGSGKYISGMDVAYAKLNDKNEYKYLTLAIIKDRIESHPYVEKADVKFDGLTKVKLSEKTFDAILMDNDRQLLITDNLQLFDMPNTDNLNLPIISNAGKNIILEILYYRNNFNIKTAFKIMGAFLN